MKNGDSKSLSLSHAVGFRKGEVKSQVGGKKKTKTREANL